MGRLRPSANFDVVLEVRLIDATPGVEEKRRSTRADTFDLRICPGRNTLEFTVCDSYVATGSQILVVPWKALESGHSIPPGRSDHVMNSCVCYSLAA
jgi:hypothetical protein